MQVPYHLHAVLVHEGQANAGHYWAYIYNQPRKSWLRYNDISVTAASWEELERDSFGGLKNASAYCLMYINETLFHSAAGNSTEMLARAASGSCFGHQCSVRYLALADGMQWLPLYKGHLSWVGGNRLPCLSWRFGQDHILKLSSSMILMGQLQIINLQVPRTKVLGFPQFWLK